MIVMRQPWVLNGFSCDIEWIFPQKAGKFM